MWVVQNRRLLSACGSITAVHNQSCVLPVQSNQTAHVPDAIQTQLHSPHFSSTSQPLQSLCPHAGAAETLQANIYSALLSLTDTTVVMASSLTAAEHRQLRSLFHLVDRDQSGSITKQELASLLHTLNSPRSTHTNHTTHHTTQPLALPATSEAIDALISECDTNNDGEIDYNEFATVMSKRAGCKYTREEVLDAMRVFGVRGVRKGVSGGGSGELSVELLERAVRMLDMGGVQLSGGASGSATGGAGSGDSESVLGVEEKRLQMLDMLAQLKVDYGGRLAYEQVNTTQHTAFRTHRHISCPPPARVFSLSHVCA